MSPEARPGQAPAPEVPHLDLKRQHRALAGAIRERFAELLDATAFVGGRAVADFEEGFAATVGCAHAVGVGNGTDALKLGLRALGVGPGHEVVVPAFTFIATAGAVLDLGARPALADVDEGTALLCPEAAAARCGPRTRALLPVHLYGMPADPEALAGLGLPVLEDAAQAIGASLRGRPAGSLGKAAAFSFYPTKNLAALGDGGAISTDDAALADRLRMLGDHGRPVDPARRDEHELPGINSRLDAIQAALLSLKLERLPSWQERRRAIAGRYRAALQDRPDLRLQAIPEGAISGWHLFVLRHAERGALQAALLERGVQSRAIYPRPLHLWPALASLGHGAGDFPRAEAWAREVLTLPMFPELEDGEVDRVIAATLDALHAVSRAGAG